MSSLEPSDERECYCDSQVCAKCAPDGPHGDLRAAVQMLAASNVRLCDIALAADKLADALELFLCVRYKGALNACQDALEAYKIARQGS